MLTDCKNEQCNPSHSITWSYLLLDKLLPLVFCRHNCLTVRVVVICLSPTHLWDILLSYALWVFVPRFSATLDPYFHLRKQKWSGFFALFILLGIVCLWMIMILFLIYIYVKFMITQHVLFLGNFSWVLIVFQWYLRIYTLYNLPVLLLVWFI